MNSQKTLVQTLTKPVLVGAVGIVVSKYLLGESGDFIVFGQNVPDWLAIGGSLVATTLAAESLGNYVLPYLPNNFQFAQTQKLLVEPILNAACLYALFKVGFTPSNSDEADLFFPSVVGITSGIAGDYLTNIITPLFVAHR
jgi:hypothetical protein